MNTPTRVPGRYSAIVLCTLALGLSACSGPRNVAQNVAQNAAQTEADDTAELEALFYERQEAARSRFTQPDVDFMTGMISHHAQALIMSRLAPTNGAGPAVRTLSARIINAQNDEIATMQNWLRQRGQAVPEVHIDGLKLTIHGLGEHGGHDMHMPGMLTDQQLQELADARGSDFDRLFLTYMIQHHKGAITMVEELFSHDGVGQDEAAFRLASDINVDQITEIARMQRMLNSLADQGRDS